MLKIVDKFARMLLNMSATREPLRWLFAWRKLLRNTARQQVTRQHIQELAPIADQFMVKAHKKMGLDQTFAADQPFVLPECGSPAQARYYFRPTANGGRREEISIYAESMRVEEFVRYERRWWRHKQQRYGVFFLRQYVIEEIYTSYIHCVDGTTKKVLELRRYRCYAICYRGWHYKKFGERTIAQTHRVQVTPLPTMAEAK